LAGILSNLTHSSSEILQHMTSFLSQKVIKMGMMRF